MASQYYCSNVAGELEFWSRKLHKLSSEIDGIPSIDKYKLQPHIDQLHILMTELDDRLCEMVMSCESVESFDSVEEVKSGSFKEGTSFTKNELFDYDFGG